MTLEDQVVSLELARKLKELGVKQESLFRWIVNYDNERILLAYETQTGYYLETGAGFNTNLIKHLQTYSAFTVAELGEMLPAMLYEDGKEYPFHTLKTPLDKYWALIYGHNLNDFVAGFSFFDNEADAHARMLIYLLENKLITLN